jgi:hypothetical protein
LREPEDIEELAYGVPTQAQSDLRNPFQSNENLALAKKFLFGERVTGELRTEYFNVLNRMQICGSQTSNLDTNVSDARATTGGNLATSSPPARPTIYVRVRPTSG